MAHYIIRSVPMEGSWICGKCNTTVRNFIVENLKTLEEYLQVLTVDPDPEMIDLKETVGIEEADPSVIQSCKHDRYLKEFSYMWRAHRNRIDRVSRIVNNRLTELDVCLEEWDTITEENEAPVIEGERRWPTMEKIIEFKLKYRDLLDSKGPGKDFKNEMAKMKSERDRLIAGVPKIKQGIINLPKDSQDRMLAIIKAQSDRFEAKNIQTRPGEWTITNFYRELKMACDEINAKNQPMEEDIPTTSQEEDIPTTSQEEDMPTTSQEEDKDDGPNTSQEAEHDIPTEDETDQEENEDRSLSPTLSKLLIDLQDERDTISNLIIPGLPQDPARKVYSANADDDLNSSSLYVDVACMLKLFKASNSVPKPTEVSPPTLPMIMAAGPSNAGDSTPVHTPTTAELREAEIAKIDKLIHKLERARNKVIRSHNKIKRALGEHVDTDVEMADVSEHSSESEEDDGDKN